MNVSSSGATLLVTDSFAPSPQALFALAHAGALAGGGPPNPVVLATLSPDQDEDVGFIERLGVHYFPVGRLGAPTIEQALAGAVLGLSATRVVVWAAPRALLALPAIRELPGRPSIEVHLPAESSTPWDETELVSVRAQNLIDRYLVEDDRTAIRLKDFGVRSRQIANPSPVRSGGGRDARAPVFVVHGASWERATTDAKALAHEVRERGGGTAAALRFRGVFRMLLRPTETTAHRQGTMVFPERAMTSGIVFQRLIEAGWTVAAAPEAIGGRFSETLGFVCLPDDRCAWASSLVGAVAS